MKNSCFSWEDLKKSMIWLGSLTATYLFFFLKGESIGAVLLSLPFFIVLYFFFFSIGQPSVVKYLRQKLTGDVKKTILFPLFLLIIYGVYLLLNGQSPFKDLLALFPFFLLFPVLAFSASGYSDKINWFDFLVFILFLLPTTLVNVQPKGDLPFLGDSFDSVYRIEIMLVAVYSFSILRRIDEVGFFPEVSLKKLWTAVWVWLAFYAIVLAIGISVDFIRIVGHQESSPELIRKIVFALITGFLHTAVFEELFFRGLLQNMLARRIAQGNSWKIFIAVAFVILFPLALLVGYTLKGGMQWFPALITFLIFAGAWFIETKKSAVTGTYSALAIASVLFGLVHYHAGSIVYIGFACLAGWGYGYVYIRTKNVFYCALTHALVGASALIFGLSLIK